MVLRGLPELGCAPWGQLPTDTPCQLVPFSSVHPSRGHCVRLTHTRREGLQQRPPRPADTRGPCTRRGPVSRPLSSVRDGGEWGGFNSPFVWTEDQWGARAAQGHLPTPGLVSQGQQLSQELPVAPEATISCQPPRGPAVPLLGLPEAPPRAPSSPASQQHQPQWVTGPKWQGGLAPAWPHGRALTPLDPAPLEPGSHVSLS